MPHLTLQFVQSRGVIVDVLLGVSSARLNALTKLHQAVPSPIRARALVDTGASGTVIDASCVKALQLSPTGVSNVRTPSTGVNPVQHFSYDVSLVLVSPVLSRTWFVVPVTESPSHAVQGFEVLLGRDILGECLCVYDGRASVFMLAF